MGRKELETFINENFAGIIQDYPWEDAPEYTVFRHADNRKWFALIMHINSRLLKAYSGESPEIDVVNLKSDPDLIEILLKEPWIHPAYHMNKRYWVSIPLDRTAPDERLINLVDLSYQLTSKNSTKRSQPML